MLPNYNTLLVLANSHTTINNLQILYEDNHLIVINKRCGDLVQGDQTGDAPLSEIIKAFLKEKYHKPGNVFLGVVHRLDRPTSGVVVFAKTSKALTRLNQQFAKNHPEKIYWALVQKQPPKNEDTLTHYIKRRPKNNKSYTYKHEVAESKRAVLHYTLIKKLKTYYGLEISLETGRHHQIRCQLAAIGCPIKGDLKYGFDRSNKNGGIHLHARKLTLIHPTKKEPITFIAPVPTNDALWLAMQD